MTTYDEWYNSLPAEPAWKVPAAESEAAIARTDDETHRAARVEYVETGVMNRPDRPWPRPTVERLKPPPGYWGRIGDCQIPGASGWVGHHSAEADTSIPWSDPDPMSDLADALNAASDTTVTVEDLHKMAYALNDDETPTAETVTPTVEVCPSHGGPLTAGRCRVCDR